MIDVSSSVVITVPALTKLPTLTCRKPVRPLNDARITVSSSRACAAATRASSAFNDASTCSRSATDSAWRDCRSRLRSYWLLLRASDASRLGERGSRLRVVHLDEDGAALDFLALLKPNRRDRVRRLRGDFDGLVRLGRADGFDLDAHRLDSRRGGDDGHGAAGGGRRRRPVRGGFRAARRGRQRHEQTGAHEAAGQPTSCFLVLATSAP